MLDLSKHIYPKRIYEKNGKELLSALRKLSLKILGILFGLMFPLILFGILPVTINDIEYYGIKGVLFLFVAFLVFYLILPYAMYAQIGIDKHGSEDS